MDKVISNPFIKTKRIYYILQGGKIIHIFYTFLSAKASTTTLGCFAISFQEKNRNIHIHNYVCMTFEILEGNYSNKSKALFLSVNTRCV